MTPRLVIAIDRLLRGVMGRHPDVIELGEALRAEREAPRVTTSMITAEPQTVLAAPKMVTQTVTPKRDRAKYMRDYRAKKTA